MTLPEPGRGLFLDFDGTVAESLGVLRTAYEEFLAFHGRKGSLAEFDSLNGPPLPEIVSRLRFLHDLEPAPEELLLRYGERIDASYDEVVPVTGADTLIRLAVETGWTVAIVTSNAAPRVEKWLNRTGLRSLISTLVAAGDTPRGKPFPDPYILALERTACLASLSFAVEDSPSGAGAAVAAGLRVFGCTPARADALTWPLGVTPVSHLAEIAPHLSAAR